MIKHATIFAKACFGQTILGVGPVLSRYMLIVLGGRTFQSASQCAAYLGLVPTSSCVLIGACDLVVSASITVDQLSGSLGNPTITFLPDELTGKEIPWLPTKKHVIFSANNRSLIATQIVNDIPAIIKWANEVTTSERRIQYY